MTNREALEVIERLGVDSRGYPKLKEAINMAIEALEKQDDEPVGCYGCVHERHGNQVCDACARSCLDRYVGGDSDDETGSD